MDRPKAPELFLAPPPPTEDAEATLRDSPFAKMVDGAVRKAFAEQKLWMGAMEERIIHALNGSSVKRLELAQKATEAVVNAHGDAISELREEVAELRRFVRYPETMPSPPPDAE